MLQSKAKSAAERVRQVAASPQEATKSDWFALLRLIQCAFPTRPKIGYSVRLGEDVVRLGQRPYLHPPANEVASVTFRKPGRNTPEAEVLAIQTHRFGMFGPTGVLPLHLTEHAYHETTGRISGGLAAFCDVLHHRFLSFLFRAWADGRKETDWDRSASDGELADDLNRKWFHFVGSLAGLGLHSIRGRDRLPDEAKLFFAGRLLQPTRSAEGIKAILTDYFGVPVQVIEFFGRKVRLPENMRWRLGAGRLGESTVAGASRQDHQSGFRIRIGPLNRRQFDMFLPGSEGFGALHDWVRLYLGKQTDPNSKADLPAAWDLQLVLKAEDVPSLQLGRECKLGWTSWLGGAARPSSEDPTIDADDVVVAPVSS